MELKELSNLIVKISGILIIVVILIGVPSYVNYFIDSPNRNYRYFFYVVIFPNIVPAFAGIYLYIYPDKITNMVLNISDLSFDKTDGWRELEAILLTVLGIYLLFRSLADFVFDLSNWYHAKYILSLSNANIQNISKGWIVANLLTVLVELFFSLLLILKAENIVKYIRKK